MNSGFDASNWLIEVNIFCLRPLLLPSSHSCLSVKVLKLGSVKSTLPHLLHWVHKCLLEWFLSRDNWTPTSPTACSFLCFDECLHEIRINISLVIYQALILVTNGAFSALNRTPSTPPPGGIWLRNLCFSCFLLLGIDLNIINYSTSFKGLMIEYYVHD